jgi:hypothetical protein
MAPLARLGVVRRRALAVGLVLLASAAAVDAGGRAHREKAARGAAAAPTAAASPATFRRPRGIYAVAVVDESAAADPGDLDALAGNPAVSGLAVRVFWSTLQPAKDRYDFSRVEQAFTAATSRHKTVQLIILPGFGTPRWVLDELPSCDPLLATSSTAPSGSSPCGKATFEVSEGASQGQKRELPLPWNAAYKSHWEAFLRQVAAQFGSRDALVSIAVTGPTAVSAEMVLPRKGDQLQTWSRLLQLSYRDAAYHDSDKAIVEEWEAAIDLYGRIFQGMTIVVTRGSGLLGFHKGDEKAAHAAILAYFASHSLGSNGRATQTSGLKACRETESGIAGVKEMAQASGSPHILAGAQFDTSFSRSPEKEGCAASCDSQAAACKGVTPEQALRNVLSVYFDGTPVGDLYQGKKGTAPVDYLQIYAPDIRYASAHPTTQAILAEASQRLLGLHE